MKKASPQFWSSKPLLTAVKVAFLLCASLTRISGAYAQCSAPTVTSPVTYCQGATATALTATGSNLSWSPGVATFVNAGGTGNLPTTTWVDNTWSIGQGYFQTFKPNVTLTSVDITIPAWESVNGLVVSLYNNSNTLLDAAAAHTYTNNTASAVKRTLTFGYVFTTPGTYYLKITAGSGNVGGESPTYPITEASGTLNITGHGSGPARIFNRIRFSYNAAPTPSTATAGTTSYQVTQTIGTCTSSPATISVVVNGAPAAPTFSAGSSSSRCKAAGAVTYAASSSGATMSYALDATSLSAGNTISSSTGAVTYTANWTGTSTITATATRCGFTTTATHTAVTNATPTASGTSTATCVGGSTGTITVSGSGGTTPYTYSVNTGAYQSSASFATLAAATYTVNVKTAAGCVGSASVTVSPFANSTESQTAAGTDSWIGHVYDGTAFTSYIGKYTELDTFSQLFGGSAVCFGITANSISKTIYTESFAIKYRMNSTKRGLYIADLGSDDGSRLTVDGTMVYNNWADQSFSTKANVLFGLTGSSVLLYEFYDNAGTNQVQFKNLTRLLANTLAVNTSQSICLGSTGAAISGDVFGTLPTGITISGTGYQWTYSTTPGGTRTAIAGATGATFTPSTSAAPFNAAGTYYVYRNAVLSSANNVSPNPYAATNESNAAVVTVSTPASATISYTGSPYCTNAGTATVTQTGTSGGVYSSTTGLSIDASTGSVNLAASTAGAYTVTYTVAATGGCSAFSTTASITVTQAPSATISYTGNPYCNGTASVTRTGTAGGTYSSAAGLSINASTGAVDVTATTPGTYTVTYTVAAANGCAAFSTSASVQVLAIANNDIDYTNGTSGIACSSVGEGGSVTLTAAAGTHFVKVGFASYGTPSGACSTYVVNTACHAATSQTVAQSYLLGNNSGTIVANNTVFTDPCQGTSKTFSVQASYAQPICAGSTPPTIVGTTPTGGNGTYTYAWQSSTTNATSGFVAAAGTNNAKDYAPGALSQTTWFRRVVTSGGCSSTSVVILIKVTPATTASISYAGSPYCSSSGTATVTQTGTTGGTYSGTAGLVIDASTGAVTLSSSTAGTHTVTYTVPASGGCPIFTTTASIVVTTQPAATGGYANPTYCTNGGYATPYGSSNATGTLSATPAGIYLDANFTNYGVINLGASAPGTYTVIYTVPAGGGCAQYTTSWPITINAAPSATIAYPGTPYCTSGGTAAVTHTGTTGGTYSSTTGLSINATTGAINLGASTPGTYTVTYTIAAANGCVQVTATASVTVTAAPTATISYSGSPYCSSSGTATVTQSGTTGGTYSGTTGLVINAATGAVTLGTSTAGTHTVTYTVSAANGCPSFTTTASIVITPQPYVSGGYTGSPFCTNGGYISPSGIANATGTFSATPAGIYTDSWFTSYGYINLGASSAGTYTVTYTVPASGGCAQYTSSSSITINAAPTGTIAYTGSPYCSGAGTATVTQTGTASGTFSSTAGLSLNASTGAVNLAASTPGTYIVTYTVTANGCTHTTTGSITITQTVPASVSIAASATTICAGTSVTFTATPTNGGTTPSYQWKLNGANVGTNSTTYTSALLQNGDVVTGVMTSTATCVSGSPATSNGIQMSVTPLPAVTGASTAIACSGVANDIPLSANTPSFFNWTIGTITGGVTGASAGSGAAINQTLSVPGSTAGTVQYLVTPTATSAAYSATATVGNQTYSERLGLVFTVNSPIDVTSLGIFDDGQNGLNGTLQVGIVRNSDGVTMAGPISMTGSGDSLIGGFRTRAISPVTLPAGTYTVVSVGHSASEKNANTAVAPLTTAVATNGGSVITFNSSSYGGVGFGLPTTPYAVSNTFHAGTFRYKTSCAGAASTITVTVNPAPAATISYAGSPYCANAGTATVTQTGTTGGTYSSTTGLSINASSGAVNLGASTPGTYTVTYTVAASGGCAAYSTTTSITITGAPYATGSYPSNPYCSNGGYAIPTGSASGPGIVSATPAGLSIDPNYGVVNLGASVPGTYAVTYTIAAAGGCPAYTSASYSITVTAAPNATISYTASPYCANGGTAAVMRTGAAGGTYSSTAGLSINATTGAINPAASTPGVYTVTYTIPAANGCAQFTTTAGVTITAVPSATIAYAGSPYCGAASSAAVTQSGTTGGTYSSTTGLSINATTGAVNPSASTPGTYTVTYTVAAAGGCAAYSTTAAITITAPPSATISYAGSPYCWAAGTASVTRTGTAGGTYASTAGISINSSTGAVDIAASTPGAYTVTYTVAAANGCAAFSTTASIQISAIANNDISYTNGTSGALCATPGEGSTAVLTAPAGAYFTKVGFASYGTPNGTCGAFTLGTCHATTSQTVAQNSLLGNGTGSIVANNTVFGDPCNGTPKRFYVQAHYAQPICSGTAPGTITGTTPTGGTGPYAYLWEQSTTSATAGFSAASGTNNAIDYTPGALTQNTWFRRTVTSVGCSSTSVVVLVKVSPQPSAAISYSGSPYCASSGAAAVTQTGTSGGTYSSTSGLSVDATTGAINPGASTPGTYTVTYTVSAAGGCAQYQTAASVTITAAPSATIAYTGSPYNNYGGTVGVTQTGTSGGTYSSTAGLYLNASTGAISLDSSTAGTYTVTYTVPASGGCGQISTTITVAIGAKYHYRSIISAAWDVASTWEWSSNGGATWTAAATPPMSSSDTVTVVNGHTVTVPSDITPSLLTVNGVLNPTAIVSVLGSGTLKGNGMLKATMPAAFTTQYAIANKNLSAMTVDFAATAAQSISGLAYYSIIVSNTAAEVGTDGNATVAGTLTVNAGAVLNGGAYTIGGAGTLTGAGKVKVLAVGNTSGDFNAQFSITNKTLTALTVEYAGTAPQYISGYTYSKLIASNSAGMTLAAATTIDSALTLAGVVDLAANHLTLGVASAIIGTPSASAMLVTNGAGEVRKRMSAIGTFTFPVGDNVGTPEYSPATIVKTSGTFPANGYISMRVVNAKHPANNSITNYLNRYWVYTQSGINGNYTGTYYYAPADVVGSETLVYSSRYRPGVAPLWTLMNAAVAASDNITSVSTNVNAEYTGTDRSGGIYLYRTRATGNWNSTAVWQYSVDGGATWVNSGTYPATVYDTVYVMNTHTVAGNLSTSPKILTVNSGGILNPSAATIYSGTGTLSGTGTIYVTRTSSGASLATQYTLSNRITDSLTVRYVANAAQTVTPVTYGNLIIAGTNTKTIAAATTAATGNITVETGATLVNSGTLKIAGDIANSSTLTTTAGAIEMNGAAAQIIPAAAFTNNLVKNLTVANTAGVTLGGALKASAIVKVTSGTLHSAGNLTLLSSASGTALVDGSGAGDITGNVTMQRYLTSRFGYKYISSPFSTATINELADDLDLTESFPTVYRYDENQAATGWQQYTTGTDNMEVGAGYAANFGTSTAADTFNITGVVNNGPVTFSGLANHNNTYTKGFNLVGNPYPSPIDWNSATGWSRTNVDNAVYYFDKGTTNRYTGSYSSYINGVSSNGVANNIIPAMQGFFVHVADGSYPVIASMTVNNAARVNNFTAAYHKQTGNHAPLVRLCARFDDEDSLADATVVYLDDRADLRYERELDALKMLNTDERVPNLYSYSSDAQKLSISAMALPGDTQRIIPLGMEVERAGTMHFEAVGMEHWPANLNVFLADRANGTTQDIRQQPTYTTSLDTGVHENRFFLVFSRTATVRLPGSMDELMAYASGQDVFVYLPGGDGEISILNALGQVVQRKAVSGTGYHQLRADVVPGVYIVSLTTATGRQSKKVAIGHP